MTLSEARKRKAGTIKKDERVTYTHIKSSLNNVIEQTLNPTEVASVKDRIRFYVSKVSKMVNCAGLIFNRYLLFLLENGKDIPDLTDDNIYTRVLIIGHEKKKLKASYPFLEEVFERYFKQNNFPPFQRFDGDWWIFQQNRSIYKSNFITSLKATFDR